MVFDQWLPDFMYINNLILLATALILSCSSLGCAGNKRDYTYDRSRHLKESYASQAEINRLMARSKKTMIQAQKDYDAAIIVLNQMAINNEKEMVRLKNRERR
jgi:hypothetical protein